MLEQIPAICINSKFFHPNPKLEEAFFRHVRLSRNFENRELLEDGTTKLRIPARLMQEKLKNPIRFQVRGLRACACVRGLACVSASTNAPALVLKRGPVDKECPRTKALANRSVR